MELSVYNIKGEDTGRKVELNEDLFGIEPNDHVIYLAVKQYLADQRQRWTRVRSKTSQLQLQAQQEGEGSGT